MPGSQQAPKGFLSTLRRIICRLLCDDTPPPPPPPAGEPLRSFEPGQVAILTEYPPGVELTPRQIVDRVSARLDRINIDGQEKVQLAPERVIILRGAQRTLATVLGDVPATRESPARLIRFISQLHQAIALTPLSPNPPDQIPAGTPKGDQPNQPGEPYPPDSPNDQSPPATAEARLAAAGARALAPDADGFNLRAASPNWLASGAPYIIGGGPGGWPVGATPATNPSGPQSWEFDLPPTLQPPILGAIDVEVAILDTAPTSANLLSAYTTWVGNAQTAPLQPLNPLLKSLLADPSSGSFNVAQLYGPGAAVGPAGALDVVYLPGSTPLILNQFPFPIPSHGLFIAGIIRSIAPKAKIRLIQALNDEAGASIASITQALAEANHVGRTAPLVINCSFTMQIPRSGDPLASIPPDLQGVPQATLDSLTQLLRDTFAVVSSLPDVKIVAAAGNTGSGGQHPLARFPAAFTAIAGTAALTQDDNNPLTPPVLADYSDQADDQPAEGFAAFGGETTISTPPLANATKGMLSVFLEWLPIPVGTSGSFFLMPNTSGWARWAGTSFATPIVSAVLANLLSEGRSPADAVAFLDSASDDTGVQNAVPVKQQP